MTASPRCEWCTHRVKAKPRGRPARFCSASCRQRAYERRQLAKQKQAEAAAFNAKNFPAWATHVHVKPKLPLRWRPRRLHCPVCSFRFVVKKRGPIPKTCSRGCARAFALYCAYQRGKRKAEELPGTLLMNDILAVARQAERGRRQATINSLLPRSADRPPPESVG